MRIHIGRRVGKGFVGASASGKQASNWLLNIVLLLGVLVYGVFKLIHAVIEWLVAVINPVVMHPWISLMALVIFPVLVWGIVSRKRRSNLRG